MTNLTKHGLEAAGFFLFCGLLLEALLQASRQRIPEDAPPIGLMTPPTEDSGGESTT